MWWSLYTYNITPRVKDQHSGTLYGCFLIFIIFQRMILIAYIGVAEPLFRWWESHKSKINEPPFCNVYAAKVSLQ